MDEEEELERRRWRAGATFLHAPGLPGLELMTIRVRTDNGQPHFRRIQAKCLMFREGYCYLVVHCHRSSQEVWFLLESFDERLSIGDPETDERWPTVQAMLTAKGIAVDWSKVEASRQ